MSIDIDSTSPPGHRQGLSMLLDIGKQAFIIGRGQKEEPIMPAKQQPLPVVHQLQDAIRASGLSLNELGRRTGVSEGQLSRFLRGDRTLTLPAAARVCLFFGLELCPQEERSTEGCNGDEDRAPPEKARTRRNAK
jgi:hypothetical protein